MHLASAAGTEMFGTVASRGAKEEFGMRTVVVRGVAFLLLLSAIPSFAPVSVAPAEETSSFVKLAGRWLGEGRLGYRGGKTEMVKCTVTYVVSEPQARQTIRCATEGDTIEVQRLATQVRVDQRHVEGIEPQLERRTLWQRNPERLQGCHPLGVELNANMDIIVKDNRQIIEIIHEQHADRPNLGPQQGMSVRSALEAIEDPGMPGA
jgi:hypothetical protein